MIDLLAGYRRVGAVTPLGAAGAANAVAIMTISTLATMVGAKTFKIERLKVSSAAGGDTWLHVGTGVGGAFAALLPPLRIINNTTDDYAEDDLPTIKTNQTITAYADAGLAATVTVQIEVSEVG